MGRGAKAEVFPNKGEQNQKWLPHPYLLGGPKEGLPYPLRCPGTARWQGNKSHALPLSYLTVEWVLCVVHFHSSISMERVDVLKIINLPPSENGENGRK